MEIFLCILFIIIGLALLIKCGDFFVDAASWFAEISGIPKLIVGATIVSIATTLPELLVSMFAAFEALSTGVAGDIDMAVGNAVGSVTANTGLIMGIALVCIPTAIKRKDYALKSALLLCSSMVIATFAKFFEIGTVASIILILIFVFAMTENIVVAVKATKEEKNNQVVEEKPDKSRKAIIINILKFVFGAAGIALGAMLLQKNASKLAMDLLHIPASIVAVTIVAIGTSLPELVTTITAISKKQASLSAGNIIGANIIDLTLILPVCTLIYGKSLNMSPSVILIDLPACFIVTIIALIPTLITKKFSRIQGVLLLIVYVAYVILSAIFALKLN